MLIVVFIIICLLWCGALTYLYWKLWHHYNSLIATSDKTTLQDILSVLLKQLGTAKKDIETLKLRCATIEKESSFHIQKVGLMRFNPFEDTGGDQSFILVLVDRHDTGVIISGLYSRSGTRWYAKKIINGKSTSHDLSEHEKKALKEAGN